MNTASPGNGLRGSTARPSSASPAPIRWSTSTARPSSRAPADEDTAAAHGAATADDERAARDEASDPAGADRTPWHALDAGEAAAHLDTDTEHGLSSSEAARRYEQHGSNELTTERSRSAWALLMEQLRSPLIYLLVVAGVVAAALGEFPDAGFIAAVVVINTVIGFVQEHRAERSIQALVQLAAPQAKVLRDGERHEIPSPEVVPGDVALLEPGARVPADVRLTDTSGLETDESLLTGESTVACKTPEPTAADTDLADRTSIAHMGTTVASGKGRGVVVTTGMDSELGHIAASVQQAAQPETPLQRRTRRFGKLVAIAVVVAAALAFAAGVATGSDPTEMFLTAVALAVSAVPEGLPVALTVALAVGVRRMAARRALIRRLPAVETLGSTTTIGSDKTGTLTANEMTVEALWADDETYALPTNADDSPPERGDGAAADTGQADSHDGAAADEPARLALLIGVLTNEAELGGDGEPARGDPTDVALVEAATPALTRTQSARTTPWRWTSPSTRRGCTPRRWSVTAAPARAGTAAPTATISSSPRALPSRCCSARRRCCPAARRSSSTPTPSATRWSNSPTAACG